jgi:hypothetical protein
MSRPRSGSVGSALRQEVHVAQHSLPGDNAYASNVAALRQRVLAAAQKVAPSVPNLLETWNNSALGATFHVPKVPGLTLEALAAAVEEEFAGAAAVEPVKVDVPGERYRTQLQKVEAFAVRVFAKGVTASALAAVKVAGPYAVGGLFIILLLWVII